MGITLPGSFLAWLNRGEEKKKKTLVNRGNSHANQIITSRGTVTCFPKTLAKLIFPISWELLVQTPKMCCLIFTLKLWEHARYFFFLPFFLFFWGIGVEWGGIIRSFRRDLSTFFLVQKKRTTRIIKESGSDFLVTDSFIFCCFKVNQHKQEKKNFPSHPHFLVFSIFRVNIFRYSKHSIL